jgi:hypothetical protein
MLGALMPRADARSRTLVGPSWWSTKSALVWAMVRSSAVQSRGEAGRMARRTARNRSAARSLLVSAVASGTSPSDG